MALYTGTVGDVGTLIQTVMNQLVNNHGYIVTKNYSGNQLGDGRPQGSVRNPRTGDHWHLWGNPSKSIPVPAASMPAGYAWATRTFDNICLTGNEATNASAGGWAQSQVPFFASAASPAFCMAAFGTTQYWLFVEDTITGNDEFVWLVIEYRTRRYSHLMFGNVHKLYNWTGGAIMHGSHSPLGMNNTARTLNWSQGVNSCRIQPICGVYDGSLHTWLKVKQNHPQGNYANGTRFGWQLNANAYVSAYKNTIGGVGNPHCAVVGDLAYVPSSNPSSYDNTARNYAYACSEGGPPTGSPNGSNQMNRYHWSYNKDTGRMRLNPIHCGVTTLIAGASDAVHPLGHVPNVHMIRMDDFFGGEYVDRGGDRYYLFPVSYRPDSLILDFKEYDDPTGDASTPFVSPTSGLGYAIRRP